MDCPLADTDGTPGEIISQPTVGVTPPLSVRISVAANMLGIDRTKTYKQINAGELDTVNVGRAASVNQRLTIVEIYRGARNFAATKALVAARCWDQLPALTRDRD